MAVVVDDVTVMTLTSIEQRDAGCGATKHCVAL